MNTLPPPQGWWWPKPRGPSLSSRPLEELLHLPHRPVSLQDIFKYKEHKQVGEDPTCCRSLCDESNTHINTVFFFFSFICFTHEPNLSFQSTTRQSSGLKPCSFLCMTLQMYLCESLYLDIIRKANLVSLKNMIFSPSFCRFQSLKFDTQALKRPQESNLDPKWTTKNMSMQLFPIQLYLISNLIYFKKYHPFQEQSNSCK